VIFSINKKYNNLSNHIEFNKMKKIIALVLMLLTLVGVSAQEISNDEYNRLKMARQKFAGFDTDKNGVLNQEDLSGIKSPNTKKQFEQVLKKQEVISKEDYISNYKVTLEEWDGERISNFVYK
jgi:hypothetical protein